MKIVIAGGGDVGVKIAEKLIYENHDVTILEKDPQQGLQLKTTGKQGSGVLSSMSKGNCFIFLGHDSESVKAGDKVIVHPFSMF